MAGPCANLTDSRTGQIGRFTLFSYQRVSFNLFAEHNDERQVQTSETLLHLAMIRLMVRRLTKSTP
jgi:hypothetical protein